MTNLAYIETDKNWAGITEDTRTLISFGSTVIQDNLQDVAIKVRIRAAHAGKLTGNNVFYTPRALRIGSSTLLTPFAKHVTSKHQGESLGPVNKASYEAYTTQDAEFETLVAALNRVTTPEQLTTVTKQIISHPTYKSPGYKGLGALTIEASLYDDDIVAVIQDQKMGTVSIGGKSYGSFCSICSSPSGTCKQHVLGMTYKGEKCFHIQDHMKLDHVGFVPDPADPNTYSVVIEDSLVSSNVDVLGYTTKDSLKGLKMKLSTLKQKASDLEILVKELFPDEVQAAKVLALYKSTSKGSRDSNYVFPEEKLLSTKGFVGAYIADKLIQDLEDDEDKVVIAQQVQTAFKKALGSSELTPDEYLLTLFQEPEVDATPAIVDEAAPAVVQDSLTAEFEGRVADRVVAAILDKLTEMTSVTAKVESAVIEDSVKKSLLFTQLETLRSEVEQSDSQITALSKEYKDSLITQILHLKNKEADSKYKTKLDGRTLAELKTTLDDLYEDATMTLGVSSAVAKSTLLAATIEDSLKPPSTDITTVATDSVDPVVIQDNFDMGAWFAQRVTELGLAKASAEYTKKINSK